MIDEDAGDGDERKKLEDVERLLKDAAREGEVAKEAAEKQAADLPRPSASSTTYNIRLRSRSSSMGRRIRFPGASISPMPRW